MSKVLVAALVVATAAVSLDATVGAAQGASSRAESHAYGLAAPVHGAAGRSAWGGWIGSWRAPDGQIVYHLDPQARRGRAVYRPAGVAPTLTYHRTPVPVTRQRQAAWILSRYGAVANPSQDAAVELAIDDLLVGGAYGLDGRVTKKRLLRLDGPTRSGVLRLAGQMIGDAQQQVGPFVVHVAKAGASDATSTPVGVTVTGAGGQPVSRAQVTVTMPGLTLAAATGAHGEPAVVAVPRAAGAGQLEVTATVPGTTLLVRSPTQHRLSRAAVAGLRATTGASATVTPASTWTLAFEQHYATPASDTRTYQTLYSGTFQDSWTCAIPKGGSTCQDPAGDACSHNVALNSGTWVDYPSVPPDSYRAGNTCVWRDYTQTSSRLVQTGGSYTPAQDGWQPASASYADGGQALAALTACEGATGQQRSCVLSDNAAVS